MINFTHKDGQVQKSNEPLATLASYRRLKVSHLHSTQNSTIGWLILILEAVGLDFLFRFWWTLKQGKILFGILLRCDISELDTDSYLEVGQEVHVNPE